VIIHTGASLTTPVGQRDHILSNPGSTITLLEYGDYECPFCGRAHAEVKRLLTWVGDQTRFVFRNFPLSDIHSHALPAALAAEAADRQGKFWEMHDLIFENQRTLAHDNLIAFAESLDLDIERFSSDMQSPELSERIREDFMSVVRSGVNGTPSFFIDGQRYIGPAEFDSLLVALRRASS
jgi:protein-disulfide isomerase